MRTHTTDRDRRPRCGAGDSSPRPRRGIVILAVLVTLVVLALAGYQYSDLMSSQYKEAFSLRRATEARVFADSGLAYATAVLSDPAAYYDMLGGNPFDNAGAFQDIEVPGQAKDARRRGRFSVVVPLPPNASADSATNFRYGVMCEAGKINVNALMKRDKTGKVLLAMLMKLPNMSQEVAASIVDWLDTDDTAREGGAENQYYLSMTPSYRCKNGSIDSLDELLLVKGVTPQLLYGQDRNRNGVIDPEEEDGSDLGLGWSAFLTVYSRELNVDATGLQRVNLNEADLQTLIEQLEAAEIDEDLIMFIALARVYGVTSTLPSAKTKVGSTGGTSLGALGVSTQPQQGKQQQLKNISSVYDLMSGYVAVPPSGGKGPTSYFGSPLLVKARAKAVLPKLFDKTSTSKGKDIFGRININLAPREVLLGLPGLKEADVDKIIDTRPAQGDADADEIFTTPAWLVTEAGLSVTTMKGLEKYVTTKSQVYRAQIMGYFEENDGPTARLEAVIDTNGGRPRVLHLRDLTELGRGFDVRPTNR
jgi:type II secretory pathway component PulK